MYAELFDCVDFQEWIILTCVTSDSLLFWNGENDNDAIANKWIKSKAERHNENKKMTIRARFNGLNVSSFFLWPACAFNRQNRIEPIKWLKWQNVFIFFYSFVRSGKSAKNYWNKFYLLLSLFNTLIQSIIVHFKYFEHSWIDFFFKSSLYIIITSFSWASPCCISLLQFFHSIKLYRNVMPLTRWCFFLLPVIDVSRSLSLPSFKFFFLLLNCNVSIFLPRQPCIHRKIDISFSASSFIVGNVSLSFSSFYLPIPQSLCMKRTR